MENMIIPVMNYQNHVIGRGDWYHVPSQYTLLNARNSIQFLSILYYVKPKIFFMPMLKTLHIRSHLLTTHHAIRRGQNANWRADAKTTTNGRRYLMILSLFHHLLIYSIFLLQGRGVSRRPPLGFVPVQGSKQTGHHPQPIGARQSG